MSVKADPWVKATQTQFDREVFKHYCSINLLLRWLFIHYAMVFPFILLHYFTFVFEPLIESNLQKMLKTHRKGVTDVNTVINHATV